MNSQIIELLSLIIKEINYHSNLRLSHSNLTKSEAIYLRIINKNPGITQYSIAKLKNIDKSLVAKHITSLEKKGFIYKKNISTNKKGIFLSYSGMQINHFIDISLMKFEHNLFSDFSSSQIEEFLKILFSLKIKLEQMNNRDYFSYKFNKYD